MGFRQSPNIKDHMQGPRKIIKEAGRIIGELLHNVETVYNNEVADKSREIMEDNSHPMYSVFSNLSIPRSGRMRLPFAATNRHPSSFVPRAIKLYNLAFSR